MGYGASGFYPNRATYVPQVGEVRVQRPANDPGSPFGNTAPGHSQYPVRKGEINAAAARAYGQMASPSSTAGEARAVLDAPGVTKHIRAQQHREQNLLQGTRHALDDAGLSKSSQGGSQQSASSSSGLWTPAQGDDPWDWGAAAAGPGGRSPAGDASTAAAAAASVAAVLGGAHSAVSRDPRWRNSRAS
jgi:hypothetical protein